MSSATDQRELSSNFEGDSVYLAAGEDVTFNMGSGTDAKTGTSHVKYLNLPGGIAYGIDVYPTVACSVTAINGKPLKAAQSISTFGWKENLARIWSFKIQAGTATTVEVKGKC